MRVRRDREDLYCRQSGIGAIPVLASVRALEDAVYIGPHVECARICRIDCNTYKMRVIRIEFEPLYTRVHFTPGGAAIRALKNASGAARSLRQFRGCRSHDNVERAGARRIDSQ